MYAWATIQTRRREARDLHWCGHVRDVVRKVDGDTVEDRIKSIMGWKGEVLARFG